MTTHLGEPNHHTEDRLLFYCKPKLLVIDELGYLPFERRSAHLFFQLVARRYERGSLLITPISWSRNGAPSSAMTSSPPPFSTDCCITVTP